MGNIGPAASKEVRPISRVFGPAVTPPQCRVEHEFRVVAAGGPSDVGELIHGELIDGADLSSRLLDPAAPDADRCGWGGALTVDGREAGIATPAIILERGFAGLVAQSTERGRNCLQQALPAGVRTEGLSTRINVSVAEDRVLGAARLFAPRFAVGLMLLMDGRRSPGLLVRPRPGRLELGGEFVQGDGLRAAVLMATGAALACSRRRAVIRRLPPRITATGVPAVERSGPYLDRRAFGAELYGLGRSCPLRTVEGRRRTAQQHLEDCWQIARLHVRRMATGDELRLVDDLVAGRRPLPTDIG